MKIFVEQPICHGMGMTEAVTTYKVGDEIIWGHSIQKFPPEYYSVERLDDELVCIKWINF